MYHEGPREPQGGAVKAMREKHFEAGEGGDPGEPDPQRLARTTTAKIVMIHSPEE
jgi:hypothetical protein